MKKVGSVQEHLWVVLFLLVALLALAGCGPEGSKASVDAVADAVTESNIGDDEEAVLSLPELEPAGLDGSKLRVVATTSIIGDVVSQVGGEGIELTILMGPGQDPHSYEPAARDLTAVANAHVVFVNGWSLEEGLLDDLSNVAEDAPLVPVSANISPLAAGEEPEEDENEEEQDHLHKGADPHVWLDPHLVRQWVENVRQALSELDPANGALYERNAVAYLAELEELVAYYDEQIASIPPDQRKLVTNHNALAYFASRYNFEVIGTVIPSASTVAEPSASTLANLVQAMKEAGVCTIFAETTINPQLAEAVAGELDNCQTVQVLTLYTGAIGPQDSGADSYTAMMRANVATIAKGLK